MILMINYAYYLNGRFVCVCVHCPNVTIATGLLIWIRADWFGHLLNVSTMLNVYVVWLDHSKSHARLHLFHSNTLRLSLSWSLAPSEWNHFGNKIGIFFIVTSYWNQCHLLWLWTVDKLIIYVKRFHLSGKNVA